MYYLLIIFILVLYYHNQSLPVQSRTHYEKYCSWAICIVLVLLAAFRSDEVGADTAGYRLGYEELSLYGSFQDVIDRYTIYYIGYWGLCKIFNMLGLPVQVWFGCLEAFYLFAMMRLINRFSKDKIFSLLVFTTIGLYSFSFAGLKQVLAMSLMMFAFMSFIDKKYLWASVLVFATYYIHQSALIFLAVFPIYFVRGSKWIVPLVFVICGLIYTYSMNFMTAMVDVLGNEKWRTYLVDDSGYTYVTFIFYATITAVSYLYMRNYISADDMNARLVLSVSTLGCGLQLLAGVSPSLFRLAFLYTPFMMILLPNTAYYANSRKKKLLRLFLMSSIIFYFLYSGRRWPYSFYF